MDKLAQEIRKTIKETLKEDAVRKDITSQILIPKSSRSKAKIVAKEPAVLCGTPLVIETFDQIDPDVRLKIHKKDGDRIKKNETIFSIEGSTQSILGAERTALNFLSYLSGIATTTNKYVTQAYPHHAKIYSTRKTTPRMRILEKYAVAAGGGHRHRTNLNEMALIKDNHHIIFRKFITIQEAIRIFKERTNKPIIIEVDTLNQFKEALIARPHVILLDNMTPKQLKKAVEITKKVDDAPLLEASGGITLKSIKSIAATGVDRISIGALTHTRQSINFSMEF